MKYHYTREIDIFLVNDKLFFLSKYQQCTLLIKTKTIQYLSLDQLRTLKKTIIIFHNQIKFYNNIEDGSEKQSTHHQIDNGKTRTRPPFENTINKLNIRKKSKPH